MSLMHDDQQIPAQNQRPPDPHAEMTHPTHMADLVGRGVAYDQGDIDPRHGTIVSATYSLSGEAVLIVHPDARPSETPANTVLMGREANWALGHLDAPPELVDVDLAARRRLNYEQARSIPGDESLGHDLAVAR